MTAEIGGILQYLIFEILLLTSSFRLQYLIFIKNRKNITDSELVITWIGINLMLGIIIASVFSFVQFNGVIQYMLAAFFVFLIVHVIQKSNLNDYYKFITRSLKNISTKVFNWKIVLLFILILPLLFSVMRPLSENDSLEQMNYILDWKFNESTPYDRYWNYVPIWELSYLPSLILTNSDNFFWFNSIKPLLIIALGTYLIGTQLKIPKNLALLLAYSGILFFCFLGCRTK